MGHQSSPVVILSPVHWESRNSSLNSRDSLYNCHLNDFTSLQLQCLDLENPPFSWSLSCFGASPFPADEVLQIFLAYMG